MAEILRVVQPVSDQELVRRVEPHESRLVPELVGDVLVKEGADLERERLPLVQEVHQPVEGASRVDDVFD
jgi:hypothetical protein